MNDGAPWTEHYPARGDRAALMMPIVLAKLIVVTTMLEGRLSRPKRWLVPPR